MSLWPLHSIKGNRTTSMEDRNVGGEIIRTHSSKGNKQQGNTDAEQELIQSLSYSLVINLIVLLVNKSE